MKISALPVAVREEAFKAVCAAPPYSVAPVDVHNLVHFVAIDIDCDDFALLKAILRILPHSQRHPIWPTRSGGRGFHVWAFISEPTPRPKLVPFLATLAEAIAAECGDGAPIEIFPHPNGHGPRPLRWFGLAHPESGERETIIDVRHPRKRDPFDTKLVLMAVRDGLGRVAPELLRPEALRRRRPLVATKQAAQAPTGARTLLDLVAGDERLAMFLARKLGTSYRLGGSVSCPFHRPDRHPSAGWVRAQNGHLLLHDFHTGQGYDLAALAHFARTGELRNLHGSTWLLALGAVAQEVGLLEAQTRALLEAQAQILFELSDPHVPGEQRYNLSSFISVPRTELPVELRVFAVLADLFLANAQAGRPWALAPVRHIAEKAGVRKSEACQLLNYFAALGFFAKRDRGPRRAQALMLMLTDPTEVAWRARLLGSWRQCSRAHVARMLGPEVAEVVFLRRAEASSDADEGAHEDLAGTLVCCFG